MDVISVSRKFHAEIRSAGLYLSTKPMSYRGEGVQCRLAHLRVREMGLAVLGPMCLLSGSIYFHERVRSFSSSNRVSTLSPQTV